MRVLSRERMVEEKSGMIGLGFVALRGGVWEEEVHRLA